MSRKTVCPCRFCDPLLWTQAHSQAAGASHAGVNWKAANVVAALAEIIEHALHPDLYEKEAP